MRTNKMLGIRMVSHIFSSILAGLLLVLFSVSWVAFNGYILGNCSHKFGCLGDVQFIGFLSGIASLPTIAAYFVSLAVLGRLLGTIPAKVQYLAAPISVTPLTYGIFFTGTWGGSDIELIFKWFALSALVSCVFIATLTKLHRHA